jgi:hypothetical protein
MQNEIQGMKGRVSIQLNEAAARIKLQCAHQLQLQVPSGPPQDPPGFPPFGFGPINFWTCPTDDDFPKRKI